MAAMLDDITKEAEKSINVLQHGGYDVTHRQATEEHVVIG
jgi:hypothetical protein